MIQRFNTFYFFPYRLSPFQGLKWCGFIFTGLCPVLLYFAPSGLPIFCPYGTHHTFNFQLIIFFVVKFEVLSNNEFYLVVLINLTIKTIFSSYKNGPIKHLFQSLLFQMNNSLWEWNFNTLFCKGFMNEFNRFVYESKLIFITLTSQD